MTMVRKMLPLAACLAVLAVAAQAQPTEDSNVKFNAPGMLVPKLKPGLPDVKPQPLAWPRLDAGAVLCRSEYDLERLAQRRSGQTVDGPVDCQIVRAPTAITIVQRSGPGRIEVKMNDAGASGWTDAWLPQKAPTNVSAAR